MPKGDEKKMSQFFLKHLKEILQKDFKKLRISEKVKILSDLTCLIDNGNYKLGLGFSETDIAIFRQITFDKNTKYLSHLFKFIQDSKNDRKYLNIPYVIIELKSGKITSDAIRARSVVAQRIKNVFPFSTFFFIGEKTSKTDETLNRQGKEFNNYFIFKQEINENDIKEIYNNFIKPFLKNLQKTHSF